MFNERALETGANDSASTEQKSSLLRRSEVLGENDHPEHPEGQTLPAQPAQPPLSEQSPRPKLARKRYSCGDSLRFFVIEVSTNSSPDVKNGAVSVKVIRAK